MGKIVLISMLLLLSGCAASGVVPIGQDTFMVSRQGAGGWSSIGTLKADAFREANTYCATQNKTIQIIDTKEKPGGFGRLPEAEVSFKCVSKDVAR